MDSAPDTPIAKATLALVRAARAGPAALRAELAALVPADRMLAALVETLDAPLDAPRAPRSSEVLWLGDDSPAPLPDEVLAVAALASRDALDRAVVRLEERNRLELAARFVEQAGAAPTYGVLFELARQERSDVLRLWSRRGSPKIRSAAAILCDYCESR